MMDREIHVSPSIKGILFDLDNTLVSTEALAEEILSTILAEYGCFLTEAQKRWMVGHCWNDIVTEIVLPGELPVSSQEIMVRLLDAKDLIVAETRPFLPGAVRALTGLSQSYPVGIVSGSFRREIVFILELLGPEIDLRTIPIVCAEDVSHGKPDPEPYRLGAARLGLRPDHILVFEDSVAGIASAKAAGCSCVAVKVGVLPGADLAQADRVIPTLEEVDLHFIRNFNRFKLGGLSTRVG